MPVTDTLSNVTWPSGWLTLWVASSKPAIWMPLSPACASGVPLATPVTATLVKAALPRKSNRSMSPEPPVAPLLVPLPAKIESDTLAVRLVPPPLTANPVSLAPVIATSLTVRVEAPDSVGVNEMPFCAPVALMIRPSMVMLPLSAPVWVIEPSSTGPPTPLAPPAPSMLTALPVSVTFSV